MIVNNKRRIDQALTQLRSVLVPLVSKVMSDPDLGQTIESVRTEQQERRWVPRQFSGEFADVAEALQTMADYWRAYEKAGYPSHTPRLAQLLIRVRNIWAHNSLENTAWFSSINTDYALRNIAWMLRSISAHEEAAWLDRLVRDPDLAFAIRDELAASGGLISKAIDRQSLAHLCQLLATRIPPTFPKLAEKIWAIEPRPIVCSYVILDFINGELGTDAAHMVARYDRSLQHHLPPCIAPRPRTEPADKVKAFLSSYHKGIRDEGNRYCVIAGPTNYRAHLNIRDSAESLRAAAHEETDVLDFLAHFPGLIHCDTVVIGADNKIILGLRDNEVASYKGMWHLVGEGSEPDKDIDDTGRFSLVETVLRGVREELHVPAQFVRQGQVTFLAWAFDLTYGSQNIECIMRLHDQTSAQIIPRAATMRREGEIRRFDAVEFTLEKCMELIITGKHIDPTGAPRPVSDTTRAGVFLAAIHEFGEEWVAKELTNAADSATTTMVPAFMAS